MSLTKKEFDRFYALKPKPVMRVHVGNKRVHFADFPQEIQKQINNQLAEKDPVLMKALKTTKFGIKINGIEVGKDNIKDFEIPSMGSMQNPIKNAKVMEPKAKPKSKKLTEKEAYDLNKAEQVSLLKKLGAKTIPRLEAGRVKKILELQ